MKRCVWLFSKPDPNGTVFWVYSHRCDNDALVDDPQLCLDHWPSRTPLP